MAGNAPKTKKILFLSNAEWGLSGVVLATIHTLQGDDERH
jgi:hypothetical protein